MTDAYQLSGLCNNDYQVVDLKLGKEEIAVMVQGGESREGERVGGEGRGGEASRLRTSFVCGRESLCSVTTGTAMQKMGCHAV